MRRLSRPLRWLERGEFFGRCAPMERQGEAFVVLPGLPVPSGCSGSLEVLEALPAQELLLVDPMTPLDFAVLLRAPGANVPVPDPGGFDPEHEGEGELLAVVTLQPLEGKWEGPPQLSEERQARIAALAAHPACRVVLSIRSTL